MGFVRELLQTGTDVHVKDETGENVFHEAARSGDVEICKGLLYGGIDVNSKDERGKNALHNAVNNGHVDLVRELLQSDVDLKGTDGNGNSALHYAAKKNEINIAIALLHNGMDIHQQNEKGDTALHDAARKKHVEMARMLWLAGADPLQRNIKTLSSRDRMRDVDRELFYQMRSGRVSRPILPDLPGEFSGTLAPPTPLQDAWETISREPHRAAAFCETLISQTNCGRSLQEWFAAHSLLVLAVTDGKINCEHLDSNHPFYWKEQLYCTICDFSEMDDEDKRNAYKCLNRAKQLHIIDSVDAYVVAIRMMQSVHLQVSMLKRASLRLLKYIISMQFSLQALRRSFQVYRQQQMTCNLLAIAFNLIPVAGGAIASVLSVGLEICNELNSADMVEYTLTLACAILEAGEFSGSSKEKQDALLDVLQEFNLTAQELRTLFSEAAGTKRQ